MRISRQFAPCTLYIETEEDLTLLLSIFKTAKNGLEHRYPLAFRGMSKKEEAIWQDIDFLEKKLKGTGC